MNYNTKGKNLFGGGLPNVYVQNIELSVSSNANKKKSDNPHISSLRDNPNFNSKLATDSRHSGGMKVELNMSMKLSSLNPLIDPIKELEYINVMVVQCTSKSRYDKINGNPFYYFRSLILSNPERDFKGGPIKTGVISLKQMFTFEYNRSRGVDLLGNVRVEDNEADIPYSLSSASDSTSFYSIPLKHQFIISDTEGGSEIPFLSYFVFAYHAKEEQAVQDSINYSKSTAANIFSIGKISSEIVINNKNINKKSFAFKETTGTFWNGPVHQMEKGQWMKYSAHSKNKPNTYLDLVEVDNVKIRDNRIYSKLASLKIDLVGNTDYTTDNEQLIDDLRKTSNLDLIKKTVNFFSDLYLTRDKANNARFMFSVNMEEFIKKNTDFPKMIDNAKRYDVSTYNRIIEKAKIRDLSVRRVRITNNQTLTSQENRVTTVQDQETVIIANSSDSDDTSRGLLSRVNSNALRDPKGDNLEPKVFGLIEEVNLGSSLQTGGIRHFTGTDFDISSKNDGEYEYSLEIEVEDPIILLLEDQLSSLQGIVQGTTSAPGFEQYYEDSLEDKSFYDSLVGQFNPSFLTFYNQKYNIDSNQNYSGNNFLFRSIGFLVKLYYQLSEDLGSEKITETSILNYLTNIASPSTGSPDGIQKVLQLMQSLEDNLKSIIQKNTKYIKYKGDAPSEADTSNISPEGARNNRTHKIQNTFANKFNAKTDPAIGYDFLFSTKNQRERNNDGLAYLSRSELSERFSLETSKYFRSDDAQIEVKDQNEDVYNRGDSLDNTKYSFLTVSNIFVKQDDKDVAHSNINSALKIDDREVLNDILSQISLINQNEGLFYGSKTRSEADRTEQNLVENIAVFQNAVVGSEGTRETKKQTSIARARETKSKAFPEQAEIDSIDEGENLFNKEQRDQDTKPLPEGTKDLLTALNQISKDDFLSDSNSIGFYFINDESGARSFKQELISNSDRTSDSLFGQRTDNTPPLNNAPNQVKALMLSLLKSDSVNSNRIFDNIGPRIEDSDDGFRDPLNAGLVFFNYKNIRKVEVFRGFESQKNATAVNSPIWSALTKQDLDTTGGGEGIFCRHTPYTNTTYGIEENKNLSLPSYNEFFFVSQNLGEGIQTTAKGDFLLKTALGNDRVSLSVNSRNNALNSKIEEFFNRRAKTTDPIASKESEAIRPEFINSNIVVKDINLTKIELRLKNEEKSISQALQKNENKTAETLLKEVRLKGFAKLLPLGFEKNAENFAEIEPPAQPQQTTSATSTQAVAQGTSSNLGGTSIY
jgi:hypothetical protein